MSGQPGEDSEGVVCRPEAAKKIKNRVYINQAYALVFLIGFCSDLKKYFMQTISVKVSNYALFGLKMTPMTYFF